MQGKILCNKLKVRNNEKDMAKSASKLKKKHKHTNNNNNKNSNNINERSDWNLLRLAKNKFKTLSSQVGASRLRVFVRVYVCDCARSVVV